ncbi:uncharacterized protein A4U43_C05F17230 [Asparagus officinalis]|uniref:RING-type E3 ubiquitin transferase n=1 Tax=Asparagus officinalis TaxID=4686 RepID=A0A5P1ESB6_ASPOF|nr:RING-H2 finger protein ATL2-like [Asparagus officinalis]ONK68902.1 uncharacterized protein A4U43_C05F17230 [Asparagus officinalis]
MSSLEEDQPASYSLSTRILTTAILTVAFVVVLLVLLHLYVRCILRRSSVTFRRGNITLFRVASEANHVEPQPIGLDQSVISSLPMLAYHRNGKDECPICLSAVEEEEMVRVLPNCKHLFHVECVDMWLHSHTTCPVCRSTVGMGDSGLVSRLGSSLRRMMSRERSGRRVQADGLDIELRRQSSVS